MIEAVRVHTRYDLLDENEETRRERNERIGIPTPSFEVPEIGFYLWEWFNDLNGSISRIDFNGYYRLISPSDFLAWSNLTGNYINSEEYKILRGMDNVYCDELNAEIIAKRNKKEEAMKNKANKTRG